MAMHMKEVFTMRKHNGLLLLTLIVFISLVIVPIISPLAIHAETNQEQTNGMKYVNKVLGFELTVPKSWEGKYAIMERENGVSFIFQYRGKTYDTIPPLFTIVYKPKEDDGWEEGLRWIKRLGTKNDRTYYYSYDASYFYDEGLPNGEEKDAVLAMWNQMGEVLNTFKMLEAEGAAATEATKQEQANGIEYVNEKLGFMLTLPQSWENHYMIKENENGSITFQFKFDGKVYEDIFLFNIFIENKELSSEEQEMLGDVGVLGIKNGKTYLIAPNVGIYFYNNYDDYFASVPKEGRMVIEAMSKQIGEIDFKVLEGDAAEEAKEEKTKEAKGKGKKSEGDTAEETKEEKNSLGEIAKSAYTWLKQNYNWLEKWLKSRGENSTELTYTFREVEGKGYVAGKYSHNTYYVIKTPADNIRSEIIKKPVSESGYMGINGGFFDTQDYQKTPTGGLSISYYSGAKETEVYNYNGTSENPVTRPTFVTYYDKKLQKTKVKIVRVKDMNGVRKEFKDYQQIKTAIGGVTYSIKGYNIFNPFSTYHQILSRRTVIGYKEENDTVYVYLMISKTSTDLSMLTADLMKMGFNEDSSMMLDGSGSTSMRVQKPNGEWLVDKGSEVGVYAPANRHVYNMVRLINTNVKKD